MNYAVEFNLNMLRIIDLLTNIVDKKYEPDMAFVSSGIGLIMRLETTELINKFRRGGYLEIYGKSIINRDEEVFLKLDFGAEIKKREATRGLQLERRDDLITLIAVMKKTLHTAAPKVKERIWDLLNLCYEQYLLYCREVKFE